MKQMFPFFQTPFQDKFKFYIQNKLSGSPNLSRIQLLTKKKIIFLKNSYSS